MSGNSFWMVLRTGRVDDFKTGCPDGCPCDEFDCEPEKQSVLVLNTYANNIPVLIKYDGK